MLSGILVFVIMARVLGPHDFGLVAYSFTLASLYVLIVDYGFSQQLLRDIGANPGSVNEVMGQVLVAKLVLSLATLLICAGYLYFFPKDSTTETVFWLLLVSSILASFCEFLNTAFRGIGQFKRETNIAMTGSVIHFVLLLGVLLIKPDVVLVAFTFILSRMIFLGISWGAYKSNIGNIHIDLYRGEVLGSLKAGVPYAADTGFTNFFQQIDTLIVNHYLGLAGVGLYQAATKWLQGAMQFAPVLANVYLPTLASNTSSTVTNNKYARMLNMKMLAIGTAGWIFFTFFGSLLSDLVYGEQFHEISMLWPYVGFLMWVRYVAASQGVILTAYGKQKIRVYTQGISIAVFLGMALFLIQYYGLKGMLLALSMTFISTFAIYIASLIKFKIPTGFNLASIVYTVGMTTLAILNLRVSL